MLWLWLREPGGSSQPLAKEYLGSFGDEEFGRTTAALWIHLLPAGRNRRPVPGGEFVNFRDTQQIRHGSPCQAQERRTSATPGRQ
jgi:hypothetical protein